MQRTLHYNFPLFEGEDVPSIIESWNPTMAALDAKLYALSVGNAGPEIIHELEQLIATVNELIGTVNDVISEVDDIQDTVNGVQYNVNTILSTVRHLQEEIDDIIADIPDTSQIEHDISDLQTAVGSLETRVTNLGNSIAAIANKAATSVQLRYASNLPVTPVFNPDTGVFEVEVPFHEYEEGATPPSDITAFGMNCMAFLYSGYEIIDFFVTMPDNERVLVTTLINNHAYKYFTAIDTYIYQDNGNDVTVRYFYPSYVDAISISIPVASEYKLGGIKVGSGLSIEHDGTLNILSNGPDLSLYKGFNYGSYLPAQIGPMANKQVSGNLDLTIWNSGGGGNGALMKINTTPLLSQNITPKQIYESYGASWSFNSNLDRVGLSPGSSIMVYYSDLGLSDSYIGGLRYNDVVKDSIEATIYCCIYDNGSVKKYPCNKLIIEYNYNLVRFEVSDIIIPAYLRSKTVPYNEIIPSEDTEINFEVRVDEWSEFMFYILTTTGTIQGTLQPISTTFTPELWRFY